MKPSIEEILETLAVLNMHKKSKSHWILITSLAEELNTHIDNVLPGLLLLQREECLQFNTGTHKLAVNVLKDNLVAVA